MGCSSSSAQTVDQEKRPGTKPEETNGSVVKNGYIAEDAQTIEAQMQLPVQTALPDDLHHPRLDGVMEPVLLALEAQEDLGSGVDLLPSNATLEVVEAMPAVEEATPIENVVTETAQDVETQVQVTEEITENVTAAQAEAMISTEAGVTLESAPEVAPAAVTVEPVALEEAKEIVVEDNSVTVLKEEAKEEAAPNTETVQVEDIPSETTPVKSTPLESASLESTLSETTSSLPQITAIESIPVEVTPVPTSPVETVPTETTPAEADLATCPPADSIPPEMTPTETRPDEVTSDVTASTESTPETALGESTSESIPVETASSDSTPPDSTPVETTPVDTAFTESSPADPAPVAPSPVEVTSAPSLPVEDAPVSEAVPPALVEPDVLPEPITTENTEIVTSSEPADGKIEGEPHVEIPPELIATSSEIVETTASSEPTGVVEAAEVVTENVPSRPEEIADATQPENLNQVESEHVEAILSNEPDSPLLTESQANTETPIAPSAAVTDSVIDPAIAAATIPELPPLSPGKVSPLNSEPTTAPAAAEPQSVTSSQMSEETFQGATEKAKKED